VRDWMSYKVRVEDSGRSAAWLARLLGVQGSPTPYPAKHFVTTPTKTSRFVIPGIGPRLASGREPRQGIDKVGPPGLPPHPREETVRMARTAHPWYRKDRAAWFVEIDGKQVRLGEHPLDAPAPRKSATTGLWNAPPAVMKLFGELVAKREAA